VKPAPTPIDREAATLFQAVAGMRACNAGGEWGRLAEADWAGAVLLHRRFDSMALHGAHIDAIDTDDPATVGCMLAQVREADGGPMGFIRPHRENPWSGEPPEFAYSQSDGMARHFGPTTGAALVAAMRALRGTSS
jgi:hypothetical protein